jgi:hypothetical protein
LLAAPTPTPITAPLAVLLQPFFFCCGCRGGSCIVSPLIDYYTFLLRFCLYHFYLHGINHSLLFHCDFHGIKSCCLRHL